MNLTEQEIREGNNLIAEFMGWVLRDMPVPFKGRSAWFSAGTTKTFCGYTNELLFHDSWDWFMPAYRKFKDALIQMHKSMPPNTANQGDVIEVDIHCAVAEVDLAKAHKFLVDAIKWYNSSNTK